MTSVNGLLVLVGAGLPAVRQRKVTTCALVQPAFGLNVVAEVPEVILFTIAQSITSCAQLPFAGISVKILPGQLIPAVTGFVGLWLVKLRRSNLLSLRCKRRILERRGIGDFALLVIGSFLGHLGGRGGDFVLDMTCVVLADTAGCHGVVVLAPCVGRRIPVVASCRKLSMLTGQFGVTNGAVDYQFFRAENSSGQ